MGARLLLLLSALLSLHEDLLIQELLLLLWSVVGVGEMHIASDGTNTSLGFEQCLKSIQLCNLMRGQEATSWASRSAHRVLVSRLVQVRLVCVVHTVNHINDQHVYNENVQVTFRNKMKGFRHS